MPTITAGASTGLAPSTTYGVYSGEAFANGDNNPRDAAITTAATAADGSFTATNAGILQGRAYVLWASGQKPVRVRSTLDVSDTGRGSGNGTLTTGSKIVNPLTPTTGNFAAGQRISGTTPGKLPAGTYIVRLARNRTGQAVTGTASTDIFTATAHGYDDGDPVVFSALTGGAGLTASTVIYYVKRIDANTFKLGTRPGGPVLDITTDLTAGTVTGVGELSDTSLVTGSTALDAYGASPPAVPSGAGALAYPLPNRSSTWQATVRQRRQAIGSET